MKKWFINEDLGVYPYDEAKQQADFPNDFPEAYDTEWQAEAEANRIFDMLTDCVEKQR